MSIHLVDHNLPLKRLRDNGYDIEVEGHYLIVRQVPYLDARDTVHCDGVLVDRLQLSGNTEVCEPFNHQMYFAGEQPQGIDSETLAISRDDNTVGSIGHGVIVNWALSCKLKNRKYCDYYEKVVHYDNVISAPASHKDDSVSARQDTVVGVSKEADITENPIQDTNYIPETEAIMRRAEGKKIAILGLGGTGSYVLDFVAKMPVAEIHIYDGDTFHNNNAYRSPGAPKKNQLAEKPKKVAYYKELYSDMVGGREIKPYPDHMTQEFLSNLSNFDFVFICIGADGENKIDIMKYLLNNAIPFVDTGIGVKVDNGRLRSNFHTTIITDAFTEEFPESFVSQDTEDDEVYPSNIQIAEINALNACSGCYCLEEIPGYLCW